jgi:pilus assembly protein Flp/PilA
VNGRGREAQPVAGEGRLCKRYAVIEVQRHFWRAEPTGSRGAERITAAREAAGMVPANHQSIVCWESVMKNLFNRFVREEEGQDLIEYALLAGLISLVCVLAITNVGTKVSTLFGNVEASIP